MRTTVTIDDDVATKLQAEMRRQRSGNFKQILNDVLRWVCWLDVSDFSRFAGLKLINPLRG